MATPRLIHRSYSAAPARRPANRFRRHPLTFGTPAGIKSFFVRNNSVEPDALLIDELRIGDTWQDVTPAAATTIPGDFNHDGIV